MPETCRFLTLPLHSHTAAAPDADCESNKCLLKVDGKKLGNVLHAYTFLRFNSIIMCLIKDHSLILHVLLDPPSYGTLTFYLPIIPLATEEEDGWEQEEGVLMDDN